MSKRVYPEEIKQKAIELRKQGFTYSEIPKLLEYSIPKNTFSGWFKHVVLSDEAKERIIRRINEGGVSGRAAARKNIKKRRTNFVKSIYQQIDSEIKDIDKITAKLCLAMLYLGEGGKSQEMFRLGNSDPKVIRLFLKLLRDNFPIDEKRFRGHVQCRADQSIIELEKFWSLTSGIPLNQFHKTQIDQRTIGKPTKRLSYKGVFVIYYYSKALFFEVKFISDIIYNRLHLGL